MENKFPLQESLAFGIKTTWQHLGLLVLSMLAIFVLLFLLTIGIGLAGFTGGWFLYSALFKGGSTLFILFGALFLLIGLIGFIIAMSLMFGLYQIALDLYDRGTSTVSRLFINFSLRVKAVVAMILYLVMIFAPLAIGAISVVFPPLLIGRLGGIILLLIFIVPALVFYARLSFATWFIIDGKAGILESFNFSWRMTQGHTGMAIVYVILVGIITTLGAKLILAQLFVIPALTLASAYIYRNLRPSLEREQQPPIASA